jgi:hypothetical protein
MARARNEKEIQHQLPLFPETEETPFLGLAGTWLELPYGVNSYDPTVLRSYAGFVQDCGCYGCRFARILLKGE